MAKRLKDLTVTKVDFVDRGANPKAHIMITKRNNKPASAEPENNNQNIEGLFKSFCDKIVSFFKEDYSIKESSLVKSHNINGGNKEMKFDVEKMTDEDAKVFKSLREKYEIEEPAPMPAAKKANEGSNGESEGEDGRSGKNNGNEPKPMPQAKSADPEITELKKRLEYFENKELLDVAKKYEILGKKPEAFVETLKNYKAAGDTVYDSVIADLDTAVAAVEKSQMFTEIGKKGNGGVSSGATSKVQKHAQEIMKSNPSLNMYQAIDKAYQMHPELINEEE